jgi:putative ATPase
MYLALAPKSNSALRALGAARRHVREHGAQLPPDALRSAAYPGARELGRGVGYDYPHDRPEKVSPQELLPDAVAGERFVELDAVEPELRDRLQRIREARHRPD